MDINIKQLTWRRKNGNEKKVEYWLIEDNLMPLVHSTVQIFDQHIYNLLTILLFP